MADKEFVGDFLYGKLFAEIGLKVETVVFHQVVLHRKGARIDAIEGDQQSVEEILYKLCIIGRGIILIVDAINEGNRFRVIFKREYMNWCTVIAEEEGTKLRRQKMEIVSLGKDTEACSFIGQLCRAAAMWNEGGNDND